MVTESMKKNIGTKDRVFRLGLSVVLFAYAAWQGSWIALLAGIFTLYEAIASWCILYQILGKSSCPIKNKRTK